MCNCHTEMEALLTKHHSALAPEGHEDFKAVLGGYSFGITADLNTIVHVAVLPVTVRYRAPRKAGGMKDVSQKSSMVATCCPFCGVRYKKKEEKSQENSPT